jgi:hypothetical protein
MVFDYKIVVCMVFPDGSEEYAIWEPLMYADMLDNKVDLYKLFYQSPEVIKTPPLEVNIWLYGNPDVKEIVQNTGVKTTITTLLVGKRICFITSI